MRAVFSLLFCVWVLGGRAQTNINRFSVGLDAIRRELKIPALSVAASRKGVLFFEKAFGYADLEHQVKTSPATIFRVASVTKTFTSTLIMQLVEQRKLNLDAPVSQYGINLNNPKITVKNLLTHTSEGIPGRAYQYNGSRYGLLGPIIEKISGKPFARLLMENIALPLHMRSTAPGVSLGQYQIPYSRLARPYQLNSKGQVVLSEYLNEFGAFGGLATTAADLLKYSAAIDRHQFVRAATQKEIFTPNRTINGVITPYGLGWFVQRYQGLDFYWHYGQTQGESAIFIKVPKLKLALAVLCNTDQLSRPFPLGDGDLFTSPVGQLFYRCFVNAEPERSFQNKELVARATMALLNADTVQAQRIYNRYGHLNFTKAGLMPSGLVIAAIKDVRVNQELSKPFTLSEPTKLRIYGVGENCSSDLSSWCDYGWIENTSGKVIWQMQRQQAKSAGGAAKNQKVEQVIDLPPGNYILRYKSDWAHAFNSWDSLPPDHFFWGIVLIRAAK